MDGLLNLGSGPLSVLLNGSMVSLGCPGLIDVNLMCNKEIYVSISFITFFIFLIMNFINGSACPLLGWLFDDHTACHMPNCCRSSHLSLQ